MIFCMIGFYNFSVIFAEDEWKFSLIHLSPRACSADILSLELKVSIFLIKTLASLVTLCHSGALKENLPN